MRTNASQCKKPEILLQRSVDGYSLAAVAAGRCSKDGDRGGIAAEIVVIMERQTDLLQVVLAFAASCGLANFLDGRQEQPDQDSDDCDDDEQLD
jgi:hypothetical protein